MAGDDRRNNDRERLRGLIDFNDMRECLKNARPDVRLTIYLRLCEFVFPRVSPVSSEAGKKSKSAQDEAVDKLFK